MNNGFYPVVIYPMLVNSFCAENPLPIRDSGATPELIPPVPSRSPKRFEQGYIWVLQGWLISVGVLVLTSVVVWAFISCVFFSFGLLCN
jgi:hypothetical protein